MKMLFTHERKMLLLNKETATLVFSVLVEIYRVFTGCLMVVFLPNTCGEHKCNPMENLLQGDTVYRVGFYANLQAFFIMSMLYIMETRRENRLRKYLWFNTHNALDPDCIGTTINFLPDVRKQGLLRLQKYYRSTVYVSYLAFAFNTILSGYLIARGYLDVESEVDERTLIAFFTSVLFLGTKLYDVYTIAFVKENIFYSAYTKMHLQFNDVKEEKKILHS